MTCQNFWNRPDVQVVWSHDAKDVPVRVYCVSDDGERVIIGRPDSEVGEIMASRLELTVLHRDSDGCTARLSWFLANQRLGGLSRAEGEQRSTETEGPSCSAVEADEADLGR